MPFEMTTDVSAPSAPSIANLTCSGDSALFIQWDLPDVVYRDVDVYFVFFREGDEDSAESDWHHREVTPFGNLSSTGKVASEGSRVRKIKHARGRVSE